MQNHGNPDPESYSGWFGVKEGPLSPLCRCQGNPYVGCCALPCTETFFCSPEYNGETRETLCFVTSDFSPFRSEVSRGAGEWAALPGEMLACAERVVAREVQSAVLHGVTHVFI